jgi:hypothetical protein
MERARHELTIGRGIGKEASHALGTGTVRKLKREMAVRFRS